MKKAFYLGVVLLGLTSFTDCFAIANAAVKEAKDHSIGGLPPHVEDFIWESAYYGCLNATGGEVLSPVIIKG